MVDLRKSSSKEQWNDYVLESGGHPLQLWGWGQLKSAHGWSAERYFGYENDEIIGGAQVLIRRLPFPLRSFAYIPRGPIGETGPAQNELLDEIAAAVKREYRSVTLSVEPDSETFSPGMRWQKSHNRVLPASTIILDLTKSESDLLAAMAKKTRQYIRKSAAEPVSIRSVKTKEELLRCLAIYHDTAKRADFNLHGDQYYIDVFTLLQDYSQVFAVYEADQPIAFLWLAVSGQTAFELYGGMNARGQELRVNYALKWHAIRRTKEWGIERYDFGGLINDGVSTFKRGWTTEDTTLAGTYDVPLSPYYALWSRGLPAVKKFLQRVKR